MYTMPCCGLVLDDAGRWKAMERGQWIATRQGQPGVRSYRFRGLSSPWLKMALLAAEFEAAGNNPASARRSSTRASGLPFEADAGDGLDAESVRELAEDYAGNVMPARACLVTAGVDVQAGWLALEIVAWGDGDEGWVLQWHEIPGDAKDPRTWAKLDALLAQTFPHPSGETFRIEAVAVDSGFETQAVYEYSIRQRATGARVYATKGAGRPGSRVVEPRWRHRALARQVLPDRRGCRQGAGHGRACAGRRRTRQAAHAHGSTGSLVGVGDQRGMRRH